MSYLSKLIEKATDTSLDLENNQIGNYRVTPQHGSNVTVYHIYKTGAKPSYSNSTRYKDKETHILTIDIAYPEIRIDWQKDYMTLNERKEVVRILKELYEGYKIVIEKD